LLILTGVIHGMRGILIHFTELLWPVKIAAIAAEHRLAAERAVMYNLVVGGVEGIVGTF